jgi:hypothetical protein
VSVGIKVPEPYIALTQKKQAKANLIWLIKFARAMELELRNTERSTGTTCGAAMAGLGAAKQAVENYINLNCADE